MRRQLQSMYNILYPKLPDVGKRTASRIDYLFGGKPVVYHDPAVHPVDRLDRGVVTISLDFEMAWAWQYAKDQAENFIARGLREREQVPHIVSLFNEFQIPATWAIVGHLFLEKCSRGTNGSAHPEMPRVHRFETSHWIFPGGDWYQHDPCTDVRRDPAWYAPDLIGQILSCGVGHEIASHSFSHVGFGSYCSDEVARAEIAACLEAMAVFGVRPATWIFPGHEEGNFTALRGSGIRIVRMFPRAFVNITLPMRRDDGIWMVHASSGIDRGKGWNFDQRLTWLKKLVDTAAETRLAAHIWLHPSLHPDQIAGVLTPFIRYCAEKRERSLIDILTMEQLVMRTETALRKHRSA